MAEGATAAAVMEVEMAEEATEAGEMVAVAMVEAMMEAEARARVATEGVDLEVVATVV